MSDLAGEANARVRLGGIAYHTGQTDRLQHHLEAALALYRQLGDPLGEACAYNTLGIGANDLARRRDYFKRALAIFEEGDNPRSTAMMYNNLELLYWVLGLYKRARTYGEQAVSFARDKQMADNLAQYLESLGRNYLGLGAFALARQIFAEGSDVARRMNSPASVSLCELGLGRAALGEGQPAAAVKWLQTAVHQFKEIGQPAEQATALAWLGAAYLALEQPEAARQHTTQAIEILNKLGNVNHEYPPQEVWWQHYQAVTKDEGGRRKDDSSFIPHPSSFDILSRAYELMLDGIATLSDEGLCRNYLNKVPINRGIVIEYTKQATRQGRGSPCFARRETPGGNVREQLQRMLINLLSNAAKFTHEGEIVISVARETRTQGERLIFSVTDTGIGIDEEVVERIFSAFEQADMSTTRQYSGTGLGLAISRKLARLLGGDLTAASTKGEGSTFILTLPLETNYE